jgi:hypothetical protein
MASTSPTMALISDVNGKLGQELKAHINLMAYNGSLQGLDGVILDGQSAPAAALTDTPTLSMILQSGKMLAAANPTEQLLTTLRALTGAGPGAPVALITYISVPGTPGVAPAHYHSVVVPIAKTTRHYVSAETGVVAPAVDSPVTTPLGFAIVEAQKDEAGGARSRRLGYSNTGLIPPPGATYGYSSVSACRPRRRATRPASATA